MGYLLPTKDDRDWKTEARAQFVKKDAEATKRNPSVDPWRTDHTHVPPTDDRDWKTEAQSQYTKKDAELMRPSKNVDPWRTDHTHVPPTDDRDWKTEAASQFVKKTSNTKFIYLEPDIESSMFRLG